MVLGDMVALARLPLNAILYRTGSRGWPLNLADDQIWGVARQGRFLGAQMARLAAMFCAMRGAKYLPRLNDARKKYAPKRNDFVVKTSLSCRGKRIS
jgi:hypothetical protein